MGLRGSASALLKVMMLLHKGQTANTGFVGHGVSHSYSTLLL